MGGHGRLQVDGVRDGGLQLAAILEDRYAQDEEGDACKGAHPLVELFILTRCNAGAMLGKADDVEDEEEDVGNDEGHLSESCGVFSQLVSMELQVLRRGLLLPELGTTGRPWVEVGSARVVHLVKYHLDLHI